MVELEALLDAAQIDRASSTLGWSRPPLKRRSSAASFSMCWRYSSSVVAPMQCSSPRRAWAEQVARVHRALGLAGARR